MMSGMGKRVAVAVLVGAVALLVSGCTGAAGPNTSTVPVTGSSPDASSVPTSVSPRPTARAYPVDVPLTGHNVRPGEKPPLYPAAAKARTQDGANAFAEFYMHTLDWAYATTNPSYMKHYTGATCGQCAGLAMGISRTAADKHWYLGGRLTVHSANETVIGPVTAPADFCSAVKIDIAATSVVDKTGKIFNGDGAYLGDNFKLCTKDSFDGWQLTYMARTS
jgi:hypothetical protein